MFTQKNTKITAEQLDAAAEWWSNQINFYNVKTGDDYKSQQHRLKFWNQYNDLLQQPKLTEYDSKMLTHYSGYQIETKEDENVLRRFFKSKLLMMLFAERDKAPHENIGLSVDRFLSSQLLKKAIQESGLSIELPIYANMTIYTDGRVTAIRGREYNREDIPVIYDAKKIAEEQKKEAQRRFADKEEALNNFTVNYLKGGRS